MIEQKVTVNSKNGIHARPASQIVKVAGKFSSKIQFSNGPERVNAKSILGVIALGASYKTVLTISADGEDEEEAVKELSQLFDNDFA